MGFMKLIRRLMGQPEPGAPSTTGSKPPVNPPPVPEEEEPVVTEITPDELRAALTGAEPPLVLDVREPYEWRQVHLPNTLHATHATLHIPMNDLPDRVGELDPSRPIVVLCAHGMRSYSVAAWLGEQGYQAASLRGGLSQWARQGGPVEQGGAG